jgi:hypothetical protein
MMKWPTLFSFVSLALAAPSPIHSRFNSTHDRRGPGGSKNVIIQMFEWNWDSIAAECTNFIGPNGYGFVQGEQVSI